MIFCFPLYIDSIPYHLLNLLVSLENFGFPKDNNIKVYCIIANKLLSTIFFNLDITVQMNNYKLITNII